MLTKATITLGFILILLGIIGMFNSDLVFGHKTIELGMGPRRVLRQETKSVPMAPIFSGVVLLGGIALVAAGAGKN
ncbi:MAG TPA: hypothetical protein VNU94_04295 [Acidobacteriaceae bacterium]|jgi:hypothetical protein|nr:hypothetical protein [Acidobacteriaceae bacterium]